VVEAEVVGDPEDEAVEADEAASGSAKTKATTIRKTAKYIRPK
jgi:hypothetical protein